MRTCKRQGKFRDSFRFENSKHAQDSKYTSFQLSRNKRLSFPSEVRVRVWQETAATGVHFFQLTNCFFKACSFAYSFISLAIISFSRVNGTNQNTNKLLRALPSDSLIYCTRCCSLCYVTMEKTHSV